MIKYKVDVLEMLKVKGFSTYKIRKDKILNETQLQQIRENKLLRQDKLNWLCKTLQIDIGDLLEYIPDDER